MEDLIVDLIIGILFVILILIVAHFEYEDGYKDGQVSAINGKVKYKLEEQEDKTTDWVEIKNKKP
jgi:hypothetical protein